MKSEYQKYRQMYLRNGQKYRKTKRIELIELLGGPICKLCGFDKDIRALQIDHINGGGHLEMMKNGCVSMYRFYLINPQLAKEKLQVLCANCNRIKMHEKKEFGRGGF